MNIRHMPQGQIAEMMARLPCFQGVASTSLSRLAGDARQLGVRRGETLFIKGEPGEAMYVLVSGQIKAYLPLGSGTTKVVALLGHGECLGLASAWLGATYPISAEAGADSHLLAVGRDALVRQAAQDTLLANRLLAVMARRVLGLVRDMESCAPRTCLQRLSCYLLQQRPTPDALDYELVLPTTKREVAARLGLAQESLSRALRQLCDDGAIEVSGRLIRVVDQDRLRAISLAEGPEPRAVPDDVAQQP